MSSFDLKKFVVDDDIRAILESAPKVIVPKSRLELIELATGDAEDVFSVAYDTPGKGMYEESTVTKCKNGVSVNYPEPYMRRRDPDCMVIGDDKETDKVRYKDRFKEDFNEVRTATFEWLKKQELIVMPLYSGDKDYEYQTLLICPLNAAFFAGGLADLQGFIPADEVGDKYEPRAMVYVAPPFRHTHYDGKQVVVHNRLDHLHEVFSFNLYPGPSAKKGIYGILLNIGETEKWVTAHASTTMLVTPYDNHLIIMHEGASGGGKSEMIEEAHREADGSILLGHNVVTDEKIFLKMADTCEIKPITDDMAMCHSELQNDKKLVIKDAEAGWFLRFNHITEYGTSPQHEKMCIHPTEPLIFLNMDAAPHSTILIWEHIQDEPGKPCSNPRVIMPRDFVPKVISGAAEVDVRSFGLRAPVCTKKKPTYGIVGCMHVLPPALAWLWRLVAPRGDANPSIIDTKGMTSEGVGSYWPFATGKMVDQANLLLDQIVNTPKTKYVLMPNQNVGSYKVGFKPQWIGREYLARKGGAKFESEQLTESRCPLLGYSLNRLRVDGFSIPKGMLQVDQQLSVGKKAYDKGAQILYDFFKRELMQFYTDDLHPLGREIIECFLNNGSVEDYVKLIKM